MKNRFPLEPQLRDEKHQPLWKLTAFLLVMTGVLVVRDCYVQANRPVCTCNHSAETSP